ncbi:unnamed protein product [Cylicocyclus nassatus]|uniref:Transthyretin-like family protein n=1 Tax=Cylicocyclus nassatus TaxID=53992 RepID=A0AA36GT37_CYLNA|nr:unnamed protein product [Cylicocyclus nassatus]
MRAFILLCLIPLCSCLLFGLIGRMQSAGIMGTLKCNGKPAPGVKLKLYEKEIFFDRKLAQSKTNASGFFKMSGSAREVTEIDPQLNIYHRCNYKGLCMKKIGIIIPSEYIFKGKQAKKYYDIGSLELAIKRKGETTDCIN